MLLSTEQVRLSVYRSPSSIPSYIEHSHSIFFFISSFSSHFCFSLLRMFPYAPAFTVQCSNSSNSPSSLPLLWLSQTNINSCHRLLCLLCWTSFQMGHRFTPQQSLRLLRHLNSKSRTTVYIRWTFIPTVSYSTTSVQAHTILNASFCTPFALS